MTCIFTVAQSKCCVCLDSHKLQCLIDHHREISDHSLIISKQGKMDLKNQLKEFIGNGEQP
jgi:hypothetical protein